MIWNVKSLVFYSNFNQFCQSKRHSNSSLRMVKFYIEAKGNTNSLYELNKNEHLNTIII
jgi:hypothetical protein